MVIGYRNNMQPEKDDDDGKIASKSRTVLYESHAKDSLLSTALSRTRANLDHDVKIIIRKQPPFFLFPDQEFEIDYAFIRSDGAGEHITEKLVQDLQELKVDATLLQMEQKTGVRTVSKFVPAEAATLTVVEHRRSASHISGTLICRIECHDDILKSKPVNSFAVKVFTVGEFSTISIGPASTRTLSLAPYKIVVSTTESWENVWFKDEGGRDKCIEIAVSAQNGKDQILYEHIPLHLTLCYASSKNTEPSAVTNQDLLQILGRVTSKSHRHIDPETGKAKIRFRVEDVSKNHQGQNFVLKITTTDSWNINPGFSPPITIRSKRTKRKGNLSGESEHAIRAGSPPWRTTTFAESGGSPKQSPVSFEVFDHNRLLQAYSGVAHWIDDVVTGLYPLQWQVLGYAQHPDGTPDYSRPYHNMPSPNAFISRILGAYNASTKKQFQILGDSIEQHTASKTRTPATPPHHDMYDKEPMGHAGYGLGGRPVAGFPSGPFDFQPPPHGYHLPPSSAMSLAMNKPEVTAHQFHHYRDPSFPMEAPHHLFPRSQAYPNMIPYQQSIRSPLHSDLVHPSGRIENQAKQHLHFPAYSPTAEETEPKRRHDTTGETFHSHAVRHALPSQGRPFGSDSTRETEVEYVLAKQHKSLKTGEQLGFPAFSIRKEILGFYRDMASSSSSGVSTMQTKFVPIDHHSLEFGPTEMLQASEILSESIASGSDALHSLQQFGSIGNMLDHCKVYVWSKGSGGPNSGVRGTKQALTTDKNI